MMQQAGSTSSERQIRDYIKSIIHIVIQLKRSAQVLIGLCMYQKFILIKKIKLRGYMKSLNKVQLIGHLGNDPEVNKSMGK